MVNTQDWLHTIQADRALVDTYGLEIGSGSNFSTRLETLLDRHLSLYGSSDIVIVRAPGRIELLGNYQDNRARGHTFSAATAGENSDVIAVASRNVERIRGQSLQESSLIDLLMSQLPEPTDTETPGWEPFVRGIARELNLAKPEFLGMDVSIDGRVKLGSGCSSSAALENAVTLAGDRLYGLGLDPMQIAVIGKCAENRYKGKGCGFLDQATSALGKILRLKYNANGPPSVLGRYQPAVFNGYGFIVVIPPKSTHAGDDGKYNTIGKDMRAVAEFLGSETSLGDVAAFYHKMGTNPDTAPNGFSAQAYKRGEFYVEEYNRVLTAKEALLKRDIHAFGTQMILSGIGSRDKLGNVTPEVNEAVELAIRNGGYARLNGGGFGGSIVVVTKDPQAMTDIMSSRYGSNNVFNYHVGPGMQELTIPTRK